MRAGSSGRCAWHLHWMRLVDAGNLGRQQYDEFIDWWQQFQPWGAYAENPGPWWASVDALWPAITGLADPPLLTQALANELLLRRADVRRYRAGQPAQRDPWPRQSGQPLPDWQADEWQLNATSCGGVLR